MIQYTCPKCGSTVAADDAKAGQNDTCPNCGNINVVPQAGGPEPQPQAPQPEAPQPEAPAPEPSPAEPAGPTPTPGQPAPPGAMSEKDARMWGMFCHLGGLLLFAQVVPFAQIIGPLIIWLIQKDKSPFIDDQGKEALNFQITVSIAVVACGLLFIPLVFVPCVGILVGVIAAVGIVAADVFFIVTAAMKANAGEQYRYPYCLRFVQ